MESAGGVEASMKLVRFSEMLKMWKTFVASSVIGVIIGIIPAAGGSIAGLIAYGEAELAEMESILAIMKEKLAAGELKDYSDGNRRFHDVVYRICPNRPAVEIVLSIKNQLKRYYELMF